MDIHERLKSTRIERGYRSARQAAAAIGIPYPTYAGHENGSRNVERERCARYAKFYRVDPKWLAFGIGAKDSRSPLPVPIVGYVAAGDVAYIDNGQIDETDPPPGAGAATVAAEVRGDSLGPLLDRALIFYESGGEPPHDGLTGKLCVVHLADGRTLVKKLMPGQRAGTWSLFSNFGPPIYDQAVIWAAPVTYIKPG